MIKADIGFYVPGATIRKGDERGTEGYLVTAAIEPGDFPDIIPDLRADTARWAQERRRAGGTLAYTDSETYRAGMEGEEEEEEEYSETEGYDENERR